MLTFLLFLLVVNAVSTSTGNTKYSGVRHSEYVSRIDPTKKFLPRSLFNKRKPLGDDQELECKIRQLALQYANQIQPFRDQSATSDALDINHYCGTNVDDKKTNNKKINNNNNDNNNNKYIYRSNKNIVNADSEYTVYVDPINGNDNNNGNINSPFLTIDAALKNLRSYKSNEATKQIIIRKGTIYLSKTINLSPTTYDNNLLIRSYPNENVTISGGILLKINELNWSRYNDGNSSHNIWMTTLNKTIVNKLFNSTILSLFTLSPHTRLTRSRFPNGHVEIWNNPAYYLNPWWVDHWYTPPSGMQYAPKQIFKDLSNCSDTSSPCKNQSHDHGFDTYTAGYDNLCNIWTPSYSYWCGENAAGGWAEQGRRMSNEGLRQLPIGMLYDPLNFPEIATFNNSISTAIFYIKHSQGWNVFWWEIGNEYDLKRGNISFGKGGYQGARVWTKTHDYYYDAVRNLPIMAGSWFIENVFGALDVETEWFYDKTKNILYYWPNNTIPGESPINTRIDLVIGNLAHLFELIGENMNKPLINVSFMDILFRDTRYTYLDEQGIPSGGDWALYNGGAFYFENTTNCSILSSSFQRLDGNCIALYGYNRNTTFYRNDFGWIGDNIIGAWGKTKDWDGTDGQQPRFTNIIGNYVHDIGLYQLQSSLFFQAKSCQNYLYGNIVYNIPRAAILINDAFGGGTEVISNLIFNSCTMSGDHGPINSWNRMPFLTNVAYGYPSFDNKYNNISLNFIFANYGAGWAVDTDDGSAWHNIESNFFYDGAALKNDYGGYNINFISNINIALNGGGTNSWNIGPVNNDGPGDTIYNNKIIIYQCTNKDQYCEVNGQIYSGGNLNNNGALKLYNNSYYTPGGNAQILTNIPHTLTEMYTLYGLCANSTANLVPSVNQIILWVKELLDIN